MDPRKRAKRKQEKLIEYLKSQGKLTDEQAAEIRLQEPRETRDDRSLQAEAVLAFIQKPINFVVRNCKRTECGQSFGTNYLYVGYCSDNCRAKDLAKIGIQWDHQKSARDRWGGEPPLVVPPSALQALKVLLLQTQEPVEENLQEEVPTKSLNHFDSQVAEPLEEGRASHLHTNPQPQPAPLDFDDTFSIDDFSLPL